MNTVQTVVMYIGTFQNAGTYCIHYRCCRSTYQLYVYILYIYAFQMSVHICILMISMFVTLTSYISRSITFIKLLYKTNIYILDI